MVQAKILVVEDEVIVARTIASQLTQLGYTVVGTASSGTTAIAKASQSQPDLVLMDVMLKGQMASRLPVRFAVNTIFRSFF
jgi:CheY-like chemotaxis protein